MADDVQFVVDFILQDDFIFAKSITEINESNDDVFG